jgi:IS5 family transposase
MADPEHDDQPHSSSQTSGQADAASHARANAKKSSVRARVEHVFAHQKNRYGLFIRTIGLARAEAKLTLANLAYNFDRLIFHERQNAMA